MKRASPLRSLWCFAILGGSCFSHLPAQTHLNVKPMTACANETWVIRWNRSDDFNGEGVDWKKWQLIPNQDLKAENFPTSMLVDYIRVWELQDFPEQSD